MTQARRHDDVSAVGVLNEPTRRQLYEWVCAQPGPVGRDAAAAAVRINRSLAAFHLDRLTEAGLLDGGYRRLTGRTGPGAGRPARVYSRNRREVAVSLPARRYARAAELFAIALEKIGATAPPAALTEAATALGADLGRSADPAVAQPDRLLSVLTDNGYEPVTDDDGVIRLRNCPFDALVDEHRPLVCGTNLALAQGIVAGSNSPAYRPAPDQRPGFCCVAFVPQQAAS